MTNITANVKFNRILAKNQFKYESVEEAKLAISNCMSEEDGINFAENKRKAREVVNPDGSLDVIEEKVAEGYLFLKDESPVEISLFQFVAHGILRFVYLLKCVTI